jgi:hypothetical protein
MAQCPSIVSVQEILAAHYSQPRYPSTDKWVKKIWYIDTMQYYSAIKNKIVSFAEKNGWKWKSSC